MGTIKGIRSIVQTTTNQLCGRLILWDVGTIHENFVMLAPNYRHVEYNLSPEIELKPYVPSHKDYEAVAKSNAAIGKVLKRFNLTQDFSTKKSWLN